jgi:hypothetical protein
VQVSFIKGIKMKDRPQLKKQNATVGNSKRDEPQEKPALKRQDATIGQIKQTHLESMRTNSSINLFPSKTADTTPPVGPTKKPTLSRTKEFVPGFGFKTVSKKAEKSMNEIRTLWGLPDKILTTEELSKINNKKRKRVTPEKIAELKEISDRDWASFVAPSTKKDSESTDLDSETEERPTKRPNLDEKKLSDEKKQNNHRR